MLPKEKPRANASGLLWTNKRSRGELQSQRMRAALPHKNHRLPACRASKKTRRLKIARSAWTRCDCKINPDADLASTSARAQPALHGAGEDYAQTTLNVAMAAFCLVFCCFYHITCRATQRTSVWQIESCDWSSVAATMVHNQRESRDITRRALVVSTWRRRMEATSFFVPAFNL